MTQSVEFQHTNTVTPYNESRFLRGRFFEGKTSLIQALSSLRTGGLFILIDKIIKHQRLKPKTAETLLDILRTFKQQPIFVHPTEEDDLISFVTDKLQTAEEISAADKAASTPLYHSATLLINATRLCSLAHEYNQLIPLWEEFLLLFYREKLYPMLRSFAY